MRYLCGQAHAQRSMQAVLQDPAWAAPSVISTFQLSIDVVNVRAHVPSRQS